MSVKPEDQLSPPAPFRLEALALTFCPKPISLAKAERFAA
jgi:hypothetical protein